MNMQEDPGRYETLIYVIRRTAAMPFCSPTVCRLRDARGIRSRAVAFFWWLMALVALLSFPLTVPLAYLAERLIQHLVPLPDGQAMINRKLSVERGDPRLRTIR